MTFNEEEQLYREAVKRLALLNYDLTSIYRQHELKVLAHEVGQPTTLDLKYALKVPTSWGSHFELQEPELSVFTIRAGGQFKLSPGQRRTLRELAGLTPTRIITITNIEFYPGTTAVRCLTISSNIHIPEHKRRHVLTKWTITAFGDFMERSYLAGVEIEACKVTEDKEKDSGKVKKTKTLDEMYEEYV